MTMSQIPVSTSTTAPILENQPTLGVMSKIKRSWAAVLADLRRIGIKKAEPITAAAASICRRSNNPNKRSTPFPRLMNRNLAPISDTDPFAFKRPRKVEMVQHAIRDILIRDVQFLKPTEQVARQLGFGQLPYRLGER